jgi:DNA processing protein
MGEADLGAWLRLTATPGVGSATARKLLAAFASANAIFEQNRAALSAVVGPRLAEPLLHEPEGFAEQLALTNAWLGASDPRHIVALGDAAYPPALLAADDPPLLLYVLGQLEALQGARLVAVVGSRNPTPQGAENARRFACALSEAGVTVVSGLALGVDAAAHLGALEGGSPTLAVVGTGLDRVYPKRHLELAHRIAAQGALVSEYPLGTPPLAPNFPKRNRIIAGLAQGTLVVEAAVQSGSLITAELATQMGREVFAVPGSIHAPQSKGCHALIRQGAKLVESAQDILEDLRYVLPVRPDTPRAGEAMSDEDNTPCGSLLAAMGYDPVGLDALQARTGWPTPDLQAQLLELELDGQVRRLPGALYQRMASA